MRLLVIGAGGHAKVVIDAARCAGFDVVGAVGDAEGRADLLGVPILATAENVDASAFIVGVGDNSTRARLFADCRTRGLQPATVIHPATTIAEGVQIGAGTLVAAGVVINVGTVIGENVILNTSCTVDHDCRIGDHAHVGPMTGLCGGVSVGDGGLLGVGCSVIPTRSIGAWATVGAGSTVLHDVADAAVVAGVPARTIPRPEGGR